MLDLKVVKETIESSKEARFHLIHSKSGLTTMGSRFGGIQHYPLNPRKDHKGWRTAGLAIPGER